MKNNLFAKLIAITFVAILISSQYSVAQNGRFSIGGELALPSGTYGDAAGTGFGGSLRYEYPMGSNLGLMLTAGYLMYGTKTAESGVAGFSYKYEYSQSMIPILAGLKYYFTEQQEGFYGMVQLGMSLMTSKTTTSFTIGSTTTSSEDTGNNSAFTYGPGIGYHLANFDFGLAYNLFSYDQTVTITDPFTGTSISSTASASGSWIGLRVAYVMGEK